MSSIPGTNRPAWDCETQFPDLTTRLKNELASIVDPEINLNIIQLGLVRNVTIEPDHAIVKMILTTPFCPYGPAMLETTRAKAEEVLGRPTAIDFGLDAWDFSMMEEGLGGDWGLY